MSNYRIYVRYPDKKSALNTRLYGFVYGALGVPAHTRNIFVIDGDSVENSKDYRGLASLRQILAGDTGIEFQIYSHEGEMTASELLECLDDKLDHLWRTSMAHQIKLAHDEFLVDVPDYMPERLRRGNQFFDIQLHENPKLPYGEAGQEIADLVVGMFEEHRGWTCKGVRILLPTVGKANLRQRTRHALRVFYKLDQEF